MTSQSEIPTGILRHGAYVPMNRLQRSAVAQSHAWAIPGLRGLGKGEKSFCSYDEDSITMAVEAGRCMKLSEAGDISNMTLASTTMPFADLQNAGIVSSALGLPENIAVADQSGSLKSGLSALSRACQHTSQQVVLAADNRNSKPGSQQEMLYGAAAAGMLTGSGEDLIARYLGSHSLSTPFFGHFRQSRERYDYQWEERWIRDEGVAGILPKAVSDLLTGIGKDMAEIKHFGLSGGPRGSDRFLAKKLGLGGEVLLPNFFEQLGDAGCAQPLLQLCAALERAKTGELIIIVSFAQGCELIAFEMLRETGSDEQHLAQAINAGVSDDNYLRMLSFSGEINLDWGMRTEVDQKTALTQQYRYADDIHGFNAGVCPSCDTVQFPRLPRCVNCGTEAEQKPVCLADMAANIATVTADWLQYCPAPPLNMGLVQFENGARVLMQVVDASGVELDSGTPLRMVFRIKEADKQRGYQRYFWKATPIRNNIGNNEERA